MKASKLILCTFRDQNQKQTVEAKQTSKEILA